MSRIRLTSIREFGDKAILMERKYKPATKTKRTEFMYDRLLFGMLIGIYGKVERQVEARYTGKKGRIDFQIGAPSNGTFLELAIGAKAGGNRTELHKLSRQRGGQRVLLLLNTSDQAVDIDALHASFSAINATKGRLPTRNDVRIVVSGKVIRSKPTGGIADFSFVWRGTKTREARCLQ